MLCNILKSFLQHPVKAQGNVIGNGDGNVTGLKGYSYSSSLREDVAFRLDGLEQPQVVEDRRMQLT
jgi:hypothetical protein